ncbi:MAG: toxin TcdB middle/N-terminal domain-containing protein [Deltaproteobacteria bacterium]
MAALTTVFAASAYAQHGVDDDRVSLPEGPGSLEGVGDDVELDPNMGSMTHAVPIELPTGFPGASPSLTLSYSSGSGSGPLGIGWSMSVPAIGRMTVRGAPAYDTDDLFDIGGAELVRVGADGGDLVYRARFESAFVRYRWVAAGAGEEGYWVAENPDGSRSYFGATPDGTLVPSARRTRPQGGTAEYALVATVDVYGHVVSYTYSHVNGTVPLLTGVTWLDDGSGAGDVYGVQIDYAPRPDALSDASRGYDELIADRVSDITVLNGSNIIRQYVLGYQDDASAGGFSRLARVQQYGTGGASVGRLYEVSPTFAYSQALGVECSGSDCDRPYLVDMGTISGSVNLANGFASLIDINADGLPDVIDTTDTGAHRFFVNQLNPNGAGFEQGFSSANSSALGTGGSFRLGGSGEIQIFDVDGDGKSDLLNTNNGAWLRNGGEGDWSDANTLGDVASIRGVDFADVRFIDIDDDKRVDILTSNSVSTTLYRNDGTGFSVDVSIMPIGAAFGQGSNLQFADMNGDGLNDPVEVRQDGTVRYRLNLGRGAWSTNDQGNWRTIPGLSINAADLSRTDLEDVNGDGIADVIIVGQTNIRYALNRNGDRFDDFQTIDSTDITGDLPERVQGTTVLYADMNANGSTDVVWFTPSGQVTYLELFPRRPNLLTQITNGIGAVQTIRYTTAAEEAARAAAAGDPWARRLQIPMQLVASIDRYVTLTGDADGSGLHEITTVSYRDGFYDGQEKQYRGFERVETVIAADAYQEEARVVQTFDVGRAAPHRSGLQLSTEVSSDGRTLSETTLAFEDCDLDEVPAAAALEAQGRMGVYFVCNRATEIIFKEGLQSASDWKTVRTEMTYDGYGNVTLEAGLGVVDVTGDELYTETQYVVPSSRWLIGLPSRQRVYDDPANTDFTETLTYYDGDAFVGLPLGEATEGFVSRVTQKVDQAGAVVNALRAERDAHGNVAVEIDPNGSVSDANTHRRTYAYDETGFFLVGTDLHNVDPDGQPYRLRRESLYERNFQRVAEATKWMRVEGGVVTTSRDATSMRYDELGRLIAQLAPNDDLDKPSMVVTYDLGADLTTVRIQTRSQPNGALDEEHVLCMDGKGREYQDRVRTESGKYQVSGFVAYNARGAPVEVWQPFVSSSADCELTAPATALVHTSRYDAIGRTVEETEPGERVYGNVLVSKKVYRPLVVETYDAEDTSSSGPHADTPTIRTEDGLGRLLRIERTAVENGQRVASGDRAHYDSTGTFSGYTNANGERHLLTTDLLGRTVQVTNSNLGTVTYRYDDASNIVSITDGRGVVQRRAYDGLNRIVERWDDANRDGSLVTWSYDRLPSDCDRTECTNLAGELAALRYPVALVDGTRVEGQDRFGYDVQRRNVFAGRRIGTIADLSNRTRFDHRDRVVSRTFADGTELTYTYDDSGRLESIPGYVERVTYEDRNLLGTIELANAARTEMTYDDLMRLATLRHLDGAGAEVNSLSYTHDRADNVTGVDDVAAGAVDLSRTYALDAWYRATAANHAGRTDTFGYDVVDRVMVRNDAAQTYDGLRVLAMTASGDLRMAYDDAGNLVSRSGMTFDRDELGRIRGITRDEVTAAHAYADEDRVLQMTSDGTLVMYGFDGYVVRDGVGTVFVEVQDGRVARREGIELGAAIYGDPNGNSKVDAFDALTPNPGLSTSHGLAAAAARVLVDAEDAKTFLHTDHLGSFVLATDAGGAVRGEQSFGVHGQRLASQGYVSAYGFTGQEHDVSTGFVHMTFRELDPATGRWDRFDPLFVNLTADQMGALGEATSGYAYVANNPGNGVDPTGLKDDKKKKGAKKNKKKAAKPFGKRNEIGMQSYNGPVRQRRGALLDTSTKTKNIKSSKFAIQKPKGPSKQVMAQKDKDFSDMLKTFSAANDMYNDDAFKQMKVDSVKKAKKQKMMKFKQNAKKYGTNLDAALKASQKLFDDGADFAPVDLNPISADDQYKLKMTVKLTYFLDNQ